MKHHPSTPQKSPLLGAAAAAATAVYYHRLSSVHILSLLDTKSPKSLLQPRFKESYPRHFPKVESHERLDWIKGDFDDEQTFDASSYLSPLPSVADGDLPAIRVVDPYDPPSYVRRLSFDGEIQESCIAHERNSIKIPDLDNEDEENSEATAPPGFSSVTNHVSRSSLSFRPKHRLPFTLFQCSKRAQSGVTVTNKVGIKCQVYAEMAEAFSPTHTGGSDQQRKASIAARGA